VTRTLTRPHSVADLERLVSQPIDMDYELARAARRGRFHRTRGGLVVPRRMADFADERGSALTGTFTETIYVSPAAGTAKNTFTTEFTINDTAAMGPYPTLPPYFFLPGYGRNTTLRIVARGVHGTTTAAPTWQHFVRFNAGTPAVPPTGPNVGSTPSPASMLAVSQTNNLFEYEADIQAVTLASAGANSTLRGLGMFTSITTANASISFPILGGNASPGTVATFDLSATTYITYSVACGTSNAANQVQLLQLIVMGLN
jgi:hypothetical protein